MLFELFCSQISQFLPKSVFIYLYLCLSVSFSLSLSFSGSQMFTLILTTPWKIQAQLLYDLLQSGYKI